MPQLPQLDQLTFKIHPAGGGSEVPVALLTQSLTTIQELIHLFALREEGRTLRQRLRLSDELKDKYVLRCRPPESGSFAIVGRVAGVDPDIFAPEQIARVMGRFQEFSQAAVAGDQDRLLDMVPDSRLRDRILGRLISLSPPAGSGHRYELFNGAGPGISLEEDLPGRIEQWLKPLAERAEVQTVTGRLEAISFSEHRVTMIYQPRRRALDCFYHEDIELMLFENRRGLIQVNGRVITDDAGHPVKIVEVEEIRELDLSPFVITEISTGTRQLKSPAPLNLQPFLSENEQLLCLRHESLGVDVFAATRPELFDELKEQLFMLWTEFAQEDDDALSSPARHLKQALLRQFVEDPHA